LKKMAFIAVLLACLSQSALAQSADAAPMYRFELIFRFSLECYSGEANCGRQTGIKELDDKGTMIVGSSTAWWPRDAMGSEAQAVQMAKSIVGKVYDGNVDARVCSVVKRLKPADVEREAASVQEQMQKCHIDLQPADKKVLGVIMHRDDNSRCYVGAVNPQAHGTIPKCGG
jgi:hypothetical protein